MKTNKLSFLIIFAIASLGIVSLVTIFYNHLGNAAQTKTNSSTVINDQLVSAENQIKLISIENNALHNEIESMKVQIAELSTNLQTSTKS